MIFTAIVACAGVCLGRKAIIPIANVGATAFALAFHCIEVRLRPALQQPPPASVWFGLLHASLAPQPLLTPQVAVGLVLFFWLVPGLFLGQRHNATLLRSWAEHMVKPFVVDGVVFYSEHNNQSLPGLILRLTTHSPSFSTYEGDAYRPLQYHNVAALDPAVVRWVVKGCLAIFVALVVWTCRTPTRPRSGSAHRRQD